MPAASTMKPGEREFAVDSGASMHMVTRRDINYAELETVRISKNPTTVVTFNGEVLAKEEATVYVWELDLFVTVMLLEGTPAVLSLGILCEELGYSYRWTSGRKPHLINKWQANSIATHQITYCSSYLVLLHCIFIARTCDRHGNSSIKKKWKGERGLISGMNHQKSKTQIKWRRRIAEWWVARCAGLARRVQFKHGLVDDESVPEHRDASSSSHELPLEPRAKVVPSKHNIFTHFPKDWNCDICLRTKITRASCRRRTGYNPTNVKRKLRRKQKRAC